MALSTVDILICLGAIALLAAAAVVISTHWVPRTSRESDGRHHLPPGMIDGPTTRLGPDTIARVQQPPDPAEDASGLSRRR